MTSESNLIGSFCRLYSVLLYAYPPEFRRLYGRPMEQLFRDRCRDLARGPGGLALLRFAGHVMADWLRTTVREGTAAVWSAGRKPAKRSSVTEWSGALLVYLFATTTLVQAYVIPTGSMEGNLLIGDHILVDRMAFADPGPLGRHILPYREVERGDVTRVESWIEGTHFEDEQQNHGVGLFGARPLPFAVCRSPPPMRCPPLRSPFPRRGCRASPPDARCSLPESRTAPIAPSSRGCTSRRRACGTPRRRARCSCPA